MSDSRSKLDGLLLLESVWDSFLIVTVEQGGRNVFHSCSGWWKRISRISWWSFSMCRFKDRLSLNVRLHFETKHACGFFAWWICSWPRLEEIYWVILWMSDFITYKWSARLKLLPHCEHTCFRSSAWVRLCLAKALLFVKVYLVNE